MSLIGKIDKNNIPNHVAIIMDGNGRWAKERGLERSDGHRKGVDSVREVVEAAVKANVKWLTIYAFSTENWFRPDDEINTLMELMVYAIVKETPDLIKNGVRLKFIGDIDRLPENTRKSIKDGMEQTSQCSNITLAVAISYSSRWELSEATRLICEDVKKGVLTESDIDENVLNKYIGNMGVPDVDLLVRTGGDVRISNFLLWQSAYAELYFTNTYWPDFGTEQLFESIIYYQTKERRFGQTSEQLETKKENI